MDPITITRYARLLAVPIPFALAGYSFAFSQNAVPLTYDLPAEQSTPIFRGVYTQGAAVVAPGGILGAASAAWLAYSLPEQQRVWATIAVMNLMPLVWTGLVMNTGIQRLLEIGKDKGKMAKATSNLEVRQLLGRWVLQNYVRAGLYVASGVLAWRATMVV
ncbi:hypothetical protein LTR78_009543 [Recurvomyces mirabilis]|uniref:DUF1772-domain-containing protein n=1 Tax=Recurvomyces mirabilis TaxID=574656 RepID=A0AAE0TN38_9PEZI|nr:hypothetical protein LTR78_009543 [Recurvomyces mirabilis]KAK5150002.1 hypothetical protein LTS14_010474 [Recurvomyces mirabilis]